MTAGHGPFPAPPAQRARSPHRTWPGAESGEQSGVIAVTEHPTRGGDDLDRIRVRVDELISQLTPAEKAGQLTQYFYFRLPGGADAEPALGVDPDSQPRTVEEALGRGEVGSLLFVTDPAEINRLQRLAVAGNRLGIPALFGFDVIHGLRTIFPVPIARSEERRVGKECRSRWSPYH